MRQNGRKFEGLFNATPRLRAAKEPQATLVQKDFESKDLFKDFGFSRKLYPSLCGNGCPERSPRIPESRFPAQPKSSHTAPAPAVVEYMFLTLQLSSVRGMSGKMIQIMQWPLSQR